MDAAADFPSVAHHEGVDDGASSEMPKPIVFREHEVVLKAWLQSERIPTRFQIS